MATAGMGRKLAYGSRWLMLGVFVATLFASFLSFMFPQRAAAYDPRPIYRTEWINHGVIKAYLHNNPSINISTTYVLRDTGPNGDGKIYAEPDAPTCNDGGQTRPLTYIEVNGDTNMTQWYYNTENKDASGNVNCTTSNLVRVPIAGGDVANAQGRHQWFFQQNPDTVTLYDGSVSFARAPNQPVAGAAVYLRNGDTSFSCPDVLVNDGGGWFLFPMNTSNFNNNAYPPANNATSEDYQRYTNNNQANANCRVAPTEMVEVFHLGQAASKATQNINDGPSNDDPCATVQGLPKWVGEWPINNDFDPNVNQYVFRCVRTNNGAELTKGVTSAGLLQFNGADFAISGHDNSYRLVAGVSAVVPDALPTATPVGSAGGSANSQADWCDQSAGDAGWWLCIPVNLAADAVALLDCQILDLLKIDTVAIFNQQGVASTAPPNCKTRLFAEGAPDSDSAASSNAYKTAWSAFRNIALAILVILGLIMVASQIMGLDIFDAYTIRKMLPKLIIATIFLTLSWNIMSFLFTASNAAADAVLAVIEYPFRGINANNGANFINATLAWIIPTLLLVGGGVAAITVVGLLGFGGMFALLGSLLLAVFSAWVLLVARDVVATALIIASPLAIVCSAYEPFEKLFSFWKGILITILISVPALAAVIGISHAGALIALVGDNIVVAMIILLAGYGLLWAVFKQLDKVTGYFGNVMSQATGRAQKALSDYRSDTMKRRRQEAIEGQRNIPFGRTMRRLSLAGQAGKGGFIGRHNRAQLAAAEQALMQRSAAKRLEEEGGRMSGDDDAMALAMQRGMTRDRFIREYQQRTGRDGRRALADMEASFGAQVGTQGMRVAAAKARWGSVSAYNDFDIDTPEGARNMYRQMMQDAGEMVADGQMSVTDVVTAMKKNNQRADISGHSFPQMMAQVAASAERLQQVRGGATNVQGRVIDENNNVVQGVQQATGASVRRNRDGQVVGQGANLISDSEIDAWMRGALEYAQPGQIVAGRTETVRILGNQMRTRLERSVAAQQQAEAAAAARPNDVAAQQALMRAERETKRQLASLAGRYEVMGQISPENARYMAETVMEHDLNMGAAGNMNIQQLVERFRQDPEFQQYRRELYGANMAGAQAALQGQAAAAAAATGGTPPGGIPTPGGQALAS